MRINFKVPSVSLNRCLIFIIICIAVARFHEMITAASVNENISEDLQRNKLKTYLKENPQKCLPSYVNPRKYFIYYCDCSLPCGGFSDRQKGFITAYLISLLTNRTFGIIHTCPRNLEEILVPNVINWKIHPSALEGLSVQKHLLQHNMRFTVDIPETDFLQLYTADVVYFQLNKDTINYIRRHKDVGKQIPWLGRMPNNEVYLNLMNLMFKPSVYFQEELSKFYEKLDGKPLTCAHLRLGGNDNPTIPEDIWIGGILKKKFMLSDIDIIWKHLNKTLNRSSHKLFVASDSDEVKAIARKTFPVQIVDTPGIITHIDTSKDRFEIEGFLKAIMDQYILSSCDSLLLTISGYGIHSGYLRGTSKHLYCFYKHNILPCSLETVNLIYEWI